MKWEISTVLKLSLSLPPGLLGLPPAWRRLHTARGRGDGSMPCRPFLPLSRSRPNLPRSLFFPSGGLEQPRGAASQRLGQREAEAVPPCATPRRGQGHPCGMCCCQRGAQRGAAEPEPRGVSPGRVGHCRLCDGFIITRATRSNAVH